MYRVAEIFLLYSRAQRENCQKLCSINAITEARLDFSGIRGKKFHYKLIISNYLLAYVFHVLLQTVTINVIWTMYLDIKMIKARSHYF